MGLGSTAKKVQQMVDMGEELYSKLNEVRAQLADLRETVEETGDRVETLEAEVAEQRAVLNALAEKEGIDVDAVRETETEVEANEPDEAETGGQTGERAEATADE